MTAHSLQIDAYITLTTKPVAAQCMHHVDSARAMTHYASNTTIVYKVCCYERVNLVYTPDATAQATDYKAWLQQTRAFMLSLLSQQPASKRSSVYAEPSCLTATTAVQLCHAMTQVSQLVYRDADSG
jgi:hypothetical protein